MRAPSRREATGVCETVADLADPVPEQIHGQTLTEIEYAWGWLALWVSRGEPREHLARRLAGYRARLAAECADVAAAHEACCRRPAAPDPSLAAFDRGVRVALAASGRSDVDAALADAGIAP